MQNQIYIHFGIVLYEMLTARVPFDADTPVSVALKQVQEEPTPPIEYNPEIPNCVNMIILKAMQKDPNNRYQTATEMLEDLSHALKNPQDDFVVLNNRTSNSPTQKIPTLYDIDLEKNVERKANSRQSNKEEKNKKGGFGEFLAKHKFVKILLIILLAIGLFFGAMFGTLSIFSRPSQIQIPNLVQNIQGGQIKEEEAISLLEEAGLTNYTVEYEYSEKVEKGYVISQTPEYQDNYSVNSTQMITIIVSKGTIDEELSEKLKSTKVKLPKKMIGKTKDELIKELETLTTNFEDEDLVVKYEITEEFNEEVEAGIVTDVDHDGGEEISLDTTLNIVVSKGSQYKDVIIPSVVNKTEGEARSTLEGLGLTVDVTYEENSNKSDGVVISQSISANKTVKEGTSITISVNKLPTKSTVTVNVNLKSLMKYIDPEPQTTTEVDEEGNVVNTVTTTPEVKSAKVMIKVGDDIIYSETKKLNTTDISATYSATGVKDVKVYVDDVVKFNKSVDFSKGNQTVVAE